MVKYCEVGDVARKLGVSVCTTIHSVLTDSVIEGFIEDASGEIEDFAGRVWGIHQETEEEHDGVNAGPMAGAILVHNTPIMDILKLEYWDGSSWKDNTEESPLGGGTGTNQTYVAYRDTGKIVFNSLTLYGKKIYRVTYTWGDEDTPGIVKRATACLAALRALESISGGSISFISQNGLQVRYAGGWQYGMQALRLGTELNMHLSRLREFMVVT